MDLTPTASKQQRVQDELASFFASSNDFAVSSDDFLVSVSDEDEEQEEEEVVQQQEEITTRRNVMIKSSDYSRRKRPGSGGGLASKRATTTSAWLASSSSKNTATAVNRSSKNKEWDRRQKKNNDQRLDSVTEDERHGEDEEQSKQQPQHLKEVQGKETRTDGDDDIEEECRIVLEELNDAPQHSRKAPLRRTRSSESIGNSSSHSDRSTSGGGRVLPRRSRSSELSESSHSHGSSGRVPPRRTKSSDSSFSGGGNDNHSSSRPRRRRSSSSNKSASDSVAAAMAAAAVAASVSDGAGENGSSSRRARRGRRVGKGSGGDRKGSIQNKLDGDNSNINRDDHDDYNNRRNSIVSTPDGSLLGLDKSSHVTAETTSCNLEAGKTMASALSKFKAAAMTAVTDTDNESRGGDCHGDNDIPKTSTRSSGGRGRNSGSGGKDRIKAVATGLVFINQAKTATDERRRSSGGERRGSRGDHGDRRGREEKHRRSRSGGPGDSHNRSNSNEGDNEGGSNSRRRSGTENGSGGSIEESTSRRRNRTTSRKESIVTQDSSEEATATKDGDFSSNPADATRESKATSTSTSSSSRGRQPSKWAGVKEGVNFINKTKPSSNNRSRSLERGKEVDNSNGDNSQKPPQGKIFTCPESPGLIRSNSDGSINVASVASPAGGRNANIESTGESSKTMKTDNKLAAASILKKALSKSLTSSSSTQEADGSSTIPTRSVIGTTMSRDSSLKGLFKKASKSFSEESGTSTIPKRSIIGATMNRDSSLKGLFKKAVEDSSSDKKKSSKWTALKGGVDFANRLIVKAGTNTLASKLSSTKKKKETEEVMDYGLMMSVSSFSVDAIEGLNDFEPGESTIDEGDEVEEDDSESDTTEEDPISQIPELSRDTSSCMQDEAETEAASIAQPNALDLRAVDDGKSKSILPNVFGSATNIEESDAFALLSGTTNSAVHPVVTGRRQGLRTLPEPSMRFDYDKTNEKVSNLSHPDTIEEGNEEEDDEDIGKSDFKSGGLRKMTKEQVNGKPLNERSAGTNILMTAIEEAEEEESETSVSGDLTQPDDGIFINTEKKSNWGAVKGSILFTSKLNATHSEKNIEEEDEHSPPLKAATDAPNVDFGLMMSMEDFAADDLEGLDDLGYSEEEEIQDQGAGTPSNVGSKTGSDATNAVSEKDKTVDGLQKQLAMINDSYQEHGLGGKPELTEIASIAAARIVTPDKGTASPTRNSKSENENLLEESYSSTEDEDSQVHFPLRCVQLCIVPGRVGNRLPMAVHHLDDERKDGVRLMSVNGKQLHEKEIIKIGLFRMSAPKYRKEGKKIQKETPTRVDDKSKVDEQVFGWLRTPSTRKILVNTVSAGKISGQNRVFNVTPPILEEEKDIEAEKEEPMMVTNRHKLVETSNMNSDETVATYGTLSRALQASRGRNSAARCDIRQLEQEIAKQQIRLKEIEGMRQASMHDLERKNVVIKRK